jgi:hypothetical protein
VEIEKRGGIPKEPYVSDVRFRNLIRIYAQTIENAIEIRTQLAERDGR